MTDPGKDASSEDAPDAHVLVGHVLADRYRIDALLGEGGMGAVFRATHLTLDRPVAVKLLHPRLTDDEHVSKRFEREALAASKLDHPGCVQVLDFGSTAKGMKYLVMQFLDGQELRDITDTALPLSQVVDFGGQILRALEHAHKRGLVHRDLKPENIFLITDDDGRTRIKLVDFGIVKLLEAAGQEKLTRLGMAFGTPAYMSPEQAAGGNIDPRTDLYAVGILLYEMLTGAPPFEADEPGILLRMQILSEPPPLPDTVPPALAAVVLKLLEKDADDRYATARETRLALEAAVSAEAPEEVVAEKPLPGPDAATAALEVPELAKSAEGAPTPAPPPETVAEPVVPVGAAAESGATAAAAPPPSEVPVRSGSTVPGPEGRSEPEVLVRSGSTVPGPEAGGEPDDPAGPEVPVRSGGTVVAGSSTAAGVAPASPMGHAPTPGASVSHAAPPAAMASASMSQGAAYQSMASGSMSQGMGMSSSASYDPLSVSSAHVPMAGGSGAVPHGAVGGYGASPGAAPRRRGSRKTAIILVVLGVLVTWGAIALVWMSTHDERAKPGASEGTKSGTYEFVGGEAKGAGQGKGSKESGG